MFVLFQQCSYHIPLLDLTMLILFLARIVWKYLTENGEWIIKIIIITMPAYTMCMTFLRPHYVINFTFITFLMVSHHTSNTRRCNHRGVHLPRLHGNIGHKRSAWEPGERHRGQGRGPGEGGEGGGGLGPLDHDGARKIPLPWVPAFGN